ncbi:PorV/PorQ family protein [candidate division KSB1 bacterium]|nr:PorV/PorQ family protein [candidate division KSB1 bacterium]
MLEKSDYTTMIENKKFHSDRRSIGFVGILTLLLITTSILLPINGQAQIRASGSLLKMMPGVRFNGMASTYTGSIDDIHALYANPAMIAFQRDWEWATNYTEWIADSYNLSLTYGKRLPQFYGTNFAAGVYYQGVRDFNSTGDAAISEANANDALFTLSLAKPLPGRWNRFAIGANAKFFRSQLDQVAASSGILDVGLGYRSQRKRMHLANFKYAIFSFGAAVTQVGTPLKFVSEKTPLPRTFRTGAAVNMGSHSLVQLQLAADYRKPRDEIGEFALGAELAWNYRFAMRAGYAFNENTLSKATFGLSYRWHDIRPLPGKNNGLRLDFAYLEGNAFFDAPMRGGLDHFPVGPEEFNLLNPKYITYLADDTVVMSWQKSKDPDLYDEVGYLVIVAKDDSSKLKLFMNHALDDRDYAFRLSDQNLLNLEHFAWHSLDSDNFRVDSLTSTMASDSLLEPGDYYWAVMAYDNDRHVRFSDRIGRFYIKLKYDLVVANSAVVQPLRPQIAFKFNSFKLTESAVEELRVLRAAFDSDELNKYFIKLGGHTDQTGPASYNKRLSQQRVHTVDSLLKAAIIDSSRLFSFGYGEAFPLVNADTVAANKKQAIHTANRRVEIYLLKHANTDTTNKKIRQREMVKAVFLGDPISYQLEVTNNGSHPARDIQLSNKIPAIAWVDTATFSLMPDQFDRRDNAMRWHINKMSPGDTVKITYDIAVNDTIDEKILTLLNTLAVNAQFDTNVTNNTTLDTAYVISRDLLGQMKVTGHIVQCQETLSLLAQLYYGDYRKYNLIYDENKSVLGSNPNLIYPDVQLIIPTPTNHIAPGSKAYAKIQGAARINQFLTAGYKYKDADGIEHDVPENVTYQWLRNGTPIPDATCRTYQLAAQDQGATITLEIRSIDTPAQIFRDSVTVGSASESTHRPSVGNQPPQIIGNVKILSIHTINGVRSTGEPVLLDALIADYRYADAENDAEGATIFQWFRNDLLVNTATGREYKTNLSDHLASFYVKVIPVAKTGIRQGNEYVSNTVVLAVEIPDGN